MAGPGARVWVPSGAGEWVGVGLEVGGFGAGGVEGGWPLGEEGFEAEWDGPEGHEEDGDGDVPLDGSDW